MMMMMIYSSCRFALSCNYYYRYDIHDVMGITDIDDKIIKRARERNTNTTSVSTEYELKVIPRMTMVFLRRANIHHSFPFLIYSSGKIWTIWESALLEL